MRTGRAARADCTSTPGDHASYTRARVALPKGSLTPPPPLRKGSGAYAASRRRKRGGAAVDADGDGSAASLTRLEHGPMTAATTRSKPWAAARAWAIRVARPTSAAMTWSCQRARRAAVESGNEIDHRMLLQSGLLGGRAKGRRPQAGTLGRVWRPQLASRRRCVRRRRVVRTARAQTASRPPAMPSPIVVQSTPPSSTTLTAWAWVIGCGFTGHVGGPASVRGAGRVAESTAVAPRAFTALAAPWPRSCAASMASGERRSLLLLRLRGGLGDRRVDVGGPGLGGRDRERRHGERGDECAGDAHGWCSCGLWWIGYRRSVIATFAPAACSAPSIRQQPDSAAAVTGSQAAGKREARGSCSSRRSPR